MSNIISKMKSTQTKIQMLSNAILISDNIKTKTQLKYYEKKYKMLLQQKNKMFLSSFKSYTNQEILAYKDMIAYINKLLNITNNNKAKMTLIKKRKDFQTIINKIVE